jgi:hypothetical protein
MVAKVLTAELDRMNGEEDHFDAKFKVLAENVRHHFKEEEGEMLAKARTLDIDFEAPGKQMLARKQELKTSGKPVRKRAAKAVSKRTARSSKKRKAA